MQREIFWYQKSRVNWLSYGEKNTKKFHLTTLGRRRRNKISSLKIDGVWNHDTDIIKGHVQGFFENLFTKVGDKDLNNLNDLMCSSLSAIDGENLCKHVDFTEVTKAITSMKPSKTPVLDGYQAIFYQKYQGTMGKKCS